MVRKIKENKKYWYFTFGIGTTNKGCFVKLFGTQSQTRKKMFSLYGENWAFQYPEDSWNDYKTPYTGKFKGTQQEYYNLKEIKLKEK